MCISKQHLSKHTPSSDNVIILTVRCAAAADGRLCFVAPSAAPGERLQADLALVVTPMLGRENCRCSLIQVSVAEPTTTFQCLMNCCAEHTPPVFEPRAHS